MRLFDSEDLDLQSKSLVSVINSKELFFRAKQGQKRTRELSKTVKGELNDTHF